MTKDNNFLAYLYLFLTVTFWAGNFVVGKLASFYEVPPFSLNFYRWLFAWLILAPFTIPEILEKRNYIIKNYKLFIVLGVTSITVFNSIVYYSLNFTQVISGVLMISTIPVMIMLFSSILKIEKTNIFQIIGVDTKEVIEAASTKWNFMKLFPGLVGGHCIGVDPYYLTYKAKQIGYIPKVILSGRNINDKMSDYVFKTILKNSKTLF